MLRNERQGDLTVLLREALAGLQSRIWTAMPGIVQSFDAAAMTCVVQPAIQYQQMLPNDTWSEFKSLPLLIDVPIVFPAGGGFALTMPIVVNDEVLVVIANRCIDAWWQNGGIQPQARPRMHDLSDAFAIPGPFSQPRKLAGVSATKVQLRNSNKSVMMEVDPVTGFHFVGDLIVDGDLNLTGVENLVVGGNITATGFIHATGAIIAGFGGPDQVGLQTHTHPANGAPPTPGT